jgi:hypothetical protein
LQLGRRPSDVGAPHPERRPGPRWGPAVSGPRFRPRPSPGPSGAHFQLHYRPQGCPPLCVQWAISEGRVCGGERDLETACTTPSSGVQSSRSRAGFGVSSARHRPEWKCPNRFRTEPVAHPQADQHLKPSSNRSPNRLSNPESMSNRFRTEFDFISNPIHARLTDRIAIFQVAVGFRTCTGIVPLSFSHKDGCAGHSSDSGNRQRQRARWGTVSASDRPPRASDRPPPSFPRGSSAARPPCNSTPVIGTVPALIATTSR